MVTVSRGLARAIKVPGSMHLSSVATRSPQDPDNMFRLFATLLLMCAATATDFTKCKSWTPPTALSVNGCEKQPCSFKPGDHISVQVSFKVDHTVSKITPDVKAVALGFTTDYPLPQTDGCKALKGSSCPLEDGESVVYDLQINIPPVNIKSDVDLTFEMTDQDSKILTCFELKGKVV